jgi:hypothetical protein
VAGNDTGSQIKLREYRLMVLSKQGAAREP